MKKIAISLIALAALSTASFAGINSGSELREAVTYPSQVMDTSTGTSALTVMDAGKASSSFERLKKISEENDQGGRH